MQSDKKEMFKTALGLVGVALVSCLFLVALGFAFKTIWFMFQLGWGLL
jgi:hypothetical protein